MANIPLSLTQSTHSDRIGAGPSSRALTVLRHKEVGKLGTARSLVRRDFEKRLEVTPAIVTTRPLLRHAFLVLVVLLGAQLASGDDEGEAMPRKSAGGGGDEGGGVITATIVVPAYKEKPNIRPLTERLFSALSKEGMDKTTELLIVDDNSRDGSVEMVETLQKEGFPVRIHVRTDERGLSSAVLKGFELAKGDRMVCMDGDLQHPPEKVPEFLRALAKSDYVLGTRYGEGFAVDKDWPWYRVVISKGARLLARPLTSLSDPMSGFFGVTKRALAAGRGKVSPVGFKIGLEVYVKSGVDQHAEVQIFFAKREAGESKLTGKVMLYYLVHLSELYRFRFPLAIPLLALLVLVLVLSVVSALFRAKPKLA